MRTNFKTFSIDLRKSLFWSLIIVTILSLGVYIYAVLATVNHTIARKNLMSQNASLEASVSELEFRNVTLKNRINLDLALARGFREVKNPVYVARSSNTLTLNTRELTEAR